MVGKLLDPPPFLFLSVAFQKQPSFDAVHRERRRRNSGNRSRPRLISYPEARFGL